ncbi:outer membrane protein, YaiO family [Pedobacter terrae]|uniref:Outer membrane protein, YaiO family n=1 Tax=Pedobacter terrae TaxID=405671 RepID=A0A1G7NS76_9SPHI|nr:YaiO family outer membrane beta-barrel protein [Pedobacter terrae]SDF76852.1 outer membrane protein, YaiO family [Pedobacter terrae]
MFEKLSLFGYYIMLLLNLLVVLPGRAQQQDEGKEVLFEQAKKAAFDQKDYNKAIELTKRVLAKNPEVIEYTIFLGRLYTWSEKLDSARKTFRYVLEKMPAHEDATLAYGNLEYWNSNPAIALKIIEPGLRASPTSSSLLLLKARVLHSLNRAPEAGLVLSQLLKIDPKNSEARALANIIKEKSSLNKINLSYDYIYFDEQFEDPWQIASVGYARQTKLGAIGINLNYANRFNDNGFQAELEAYPKISKTFYGYVSGAYSANKGVFPGYRASFSLFANLPSAFEGEVGVRFIHFSQTNTIYTLALGKYYKNYLFNIRTYLTPSKNNIAQAYSMNVRYYYGGADDYLSVSAGTGISPDDTQNNVLLDSSYQLKSTNLSAAYRHAINFKNVFSIGLTWFNQEYKQQKWGNQYNINLTYQFRL